MAAMAMGMMMQDWIDAGKRPVVAPQQPARKATANGPDAFRNTFAILHNLDASELNGIASWGNTWPPSSLSSFILKLDDARLDALYALVQSRQPERYRDAA